MVAKEGGITRAAELLHLSQPMIRCGCTSEYPMLLPPQNTTVRRALEQWFDDTDVRPETMREFEDSALMKVFAQAGAGMIAVPTPVAEEVRRQYSLEPIGRIPEVNERFYAISVERRLKHPAVLAILESARENLFENPAAKG